jgi:hypothetical protein
MHEAARRAVQRAVAKRFSDEGQTGQLGQSDRAPDGAGGTSRRRDQRCAQRVADLAQQHDVVRVGLGLGLVGLAALRCMRL